MVHNSRRDNRLDKEEREYYRLRIWIDADEPSILDSISEVKYHLHPTFKSPLRIETDRASKFALATAAWGEFNMFAEIVFRDHTPTLRIERYIDLS